MRQVPSGKDGHTPHYRRSRSHPEADADRWASAGPLVGEDITDRAAFMRTASASPPEAPISPTAPAAPTAPASQVVTLGMTSPAVEQLLSLRRLRRTDWTLIVSVGVLLTIGLLMVFSASQALPQTSPWDVLRRQALSAAIGLLLLVVAARVDYHHWWRLALPGLIATLGLMSLTLLVGREANGAQRWLGDTYSFQPSEPAKLALVLFLADWFARVGPGIRSVRWGLLPFLGAAGGLVGLTLAQRDMGTATVIIALSFGLYFTAGARPTHLVALAGLGALSLGALALSVSYRRARLSAFLDPLPPGCHEQNSYQVCQGLLSLGSSGWLGAGLGASVQKAGYLPFPQTDSIYAVLGGELGLLGCASAVALLAVVVWRGYLAGRRAPDAFGALLACGIATWLGAQTVINIGSVVAAIPFTGVPLPFISYGGAALVSELTAVGVLLNIYAQGAPLRRAARARRGRDGHEDSSLTPPPTSPGMPLATPAHA